MNSDGLIGSFLNQLDKRISLMSDFNELKKAT